MLSIDVLDNGYRFLPSGELAVAKQARQCRVKVFRNLHFRDRVMWSIQNYNKSRKTWLLMMHTPTVILRNAEFQVSQAGRQRVLRTRRKIVHAFVLGDLVLDPDRSMSGVPVTYNPYKYSQFVVAPGYSSDDFEALDEIDSADMVWLTDTGKLFAESPRK